MAKEQLQERELVLGTVDKIIGTTVFVKIEGNKEGTITTSEIAPGRIRNLRDYVIPGKKIVCMVLSIKGDRIYLSLRRVGLNEKKDFLQKIEKEKAYKAILKTVLGENETEKILDKIQEDYTVADFFNEIRENPELADKYLGKENREKIIKILESKKEKPKQIKQIFRLSSRDCNGIIKIKNIIFSSCKNCSNNINYLGAGKYSLTMSGDNLKKLGSEINAIMQSIEKQAKKEHCEFSIEKN